MRVRLESVGCRLNIGEIDAMARMLAAQGHRVVSVGETADLVVLNTCAVTAIASKKSRQLIRQIKRSNPAASVVVTGCDTELEPQSALDAGVDLVVCNADKDRLLDLADRAGLINEPEPDFEDSVYCAPGGTTRTRAFVKAQDGCDNRCTFCITTVARGPGRSVPREKLVNDVRDLVNLGYREVVLTGVHLGSYGHDLNEPSALRALVEAILESTDLGRLRLSSLEPWDLEPEFFTVFSDPRLMPHLHLPLQSGCDATLKRMARKTCRAEFRELVGTARAAVPDLAVSTDVIVGFPGEDDDEFRQSISFVRDLAFSRLHIFRYSRREGTPAAGFPDQVPGAVAQERSRLMHALAAELEQRFNSKWSGRTAEVLWETAEDLGDSLRWSGLTPNYVRVSTVTDPDEDLMNTVTPTTITDVVPGGVVGTVRNG